MNDPCSNSILRQLAWISRTALYCACAVKSLCQMTSEERRTLFQQLAPVCGYNARDLARMCGISPRQLRRYFQTDFGRTPQDWLNEQPMRAAAGLLPAAESIKQIRPLLGFSCANNFARDFQRVHGMTPSEFLHQEHGSI